MAQVDRWTVKILSLPIFSDEFSQAVASTPLSSPAFISAMDVSSAADFSATVAGWSGGVDEKILEALMADVSMLETFWALSSRAEKVFFESTATQLGFGVCLGSRPPEPDSPLAKLRKAAAVKALLNKPAMPGKRYKPAGPDSSSGTPLLDQENAEKAKWASRLEAIGRRAGVEAKFFQQTGSGEELTHHELAKLQKLVLLSGAPRSMAAHIRAFERWEHWAMSNSLELYPLSTDKVLKYCLLLDQRECGPSVIPSFKTSIKWVVARLTIDLPDLEDQRIKAIQDQVVAARATTLKEAIPIPIWTVGALEGIVCDARDQVPTRLFVWWILCMVFTSLRFDDAIHVKPSELVMKDEGLFGVAWQTKTERKRAGTKFVVPKVGFKYQEWLQQGWDLFVQQSQDRDYWIRG